MTVRRKGKHLVDDETGEILPELPVVDQSEIETNARLYMKTHAVYFKTPYNHDTDTESSRVATPTIGESLTKQEFKQETDINVILDRFLKTGEPPPMPLPEHFADLSGRTTHFEMASKIAEANAMFYLLPASKRAEHLNDPTRWADAVIDALNAGDRDRVLELGIDLKEAPQPKPDATEPPTPTGGTPAPGPAAGASDASKTAPSGAST